MDPEIRIKPVPKPEYKTPLVWKAIIVFLIIRLFFYEVRVDDLTKRVKALEFQQQAFGKVKQVEQEPSK